MTEEALARFRKDYTAALSAYIASGEEADLAEAYDLGREAIANGFGLLDLVGVHQAAREDCRDSLSELAGGPVEERVSAFHLQALATFDMAQRGFWEAQERVRIERNQAQRLKAMADAFVAIVARDTYAERLDESVQRARAVVAAGHAAITATCGDDLCHASTGVVPDPLEGPIRRAERSRRVQRPAEGEGGDAWLCVPVPERFGVARGTLTVWGRSEPFADRDEAVLDQLAQFVALALEIVWRLDQEHEIAVTLQRQIDCRVQKRMAGTDECS